ncbi:MAG: alpha-glycosidase [Bacilli bacterium]|nr:alpha-glycosidase [Bacilli bacterium]
MLNATIYHEAKSKYAYIYDKDTVHLRLFASINKITSIQVLFGDPFNHAPNPNNSDRWEWVNEGNSDTLMKKEFSTDQYDYFFIALKPKYKRMKYAFIVNNQYLYGCREIVDLTIDPAATSNLFNFFNYPYLNEEDIFSAPSWIQDQVWYSIFPERFCNGDSSINHPQTLEWGETDRYSNEQRFGGDLRGIIDKLEYIKSVGFTGIYMTPIFESDSTHKYDVNNYYKIDDAFGNNETFRELVEKAHEIGLKIMLDAVFNHCGFRHPFFQDVITNGKNSPYYDCFYIIDKEKEPINFALKEDRTIDREKIKGVFRNHDLLNYRTFAFTPYMPKLNTNHPIMKKHLLEAAKYWISEYNIDGWRLDVSNEVGHKFWREFRDTVKSAKKDAYIVGENWDNSYPWLQGDQYDGVMNYELLFPIWSYFGTNTTTPQYTSTQFKHKINKVLVDYPKNVLRAMYNLVDSHDTTRILEICSNNVELVKLPYIFLFSFPGAPSIYYGGEVGISGKHDPDNRRCMIWDPKKQNQEILSHIKKLIQLRKHSEDFKGTEIEWLCADDEKELLIYKKGETYFIMNKNGSTQTISLPIELQNQMVHDLYNDCSKALHTTITLPAYEFLIFNIKQ